MAGDIEHIGDYCKNIVQFAKEKTKNSYRFSDKAYAEIYECFDLAQIMMTVTMTALENGDIVTSDISLSEKTETLIRFANNAGGLDNITVALVRFDKEDKA